MVQDNNPSAQWPAGRVMFAGWFLIGLAFGVGGWWAASYEIAGAVVTHGELRAKSQPKLVAHPTGGVVAEIRTHEGARVSEGDVLIELESLLEEVGQSILDAQITDAQTQAVRLRAERDGVAALEFPPELMARAAADPALMLKLADQRAQFSVGAAGLRERLTQFSERERQLEQVIEANRARIRSFSMQLDLLQKDIEEQEALLERGFIAANRVRELKSRQAGLSGERAALVADNARLNGQINETRAMSSQAKSDRREAAIVRLQETLARFAELTERHRAAANALKKIAMTAPQSGVVQGMSVFAPGAVLGPGEAALTIIPTDDQLVIEARVAPNDRDRVHLNQGARVKFTTFNSRTTPEIPATISRISADRKIDANSQVAWYAVELTLAENAAAMINKTPEGQPHTLAAGMPAEVFIATEPRTVMSFLTKPLLESVDRAGRER